MSFVYSFSSRTLGKDESHGKLLSWHPQCIEIGGIRLNYDLSGLARRCHRLGIEVAARTPLYSTDIESGLGKKDTPAWSELDRNADIVRRLGLSYILVHFPIGNSRADGAAQLAETRRIAAMLRDLEEAKGVRIMCEPVVGPRKDPAAFSMLMTISEEELRDWGLTFCVDVGDLYLASRKLDEPYDKMLDHLAPFCEVVHLHHVWIGGTRPYWTPVAAHGNVPIALTMKRLGATAPRDIYAVVDHHPHRTLGHEQVAQGVNWLLSTFGPWKDREGWTTYDGKYQEAAMGRLTIPAPPRS